jgi:hypothetical protein
MQELAMKTIDDLFDGVAPLGEQFLIKNDVTLDEAYDLADRIANAITVSEYLLQSAPNEWAMAFSMAKLT